MKYFDILQNVCHVNLDYVSLVTQVLIALNRMITRSFMGDILFKEETLTSGSPQMGPENQNLAWMKGVVSETLFTELSHRPIHHIRPSK